MAGRPLREARWPFDPLRDARPDDHPAAPPASLDQALRVERRQGAAEGVAGHPESRAQLPFRGKAAPRQEPAGADVGLDPPEHLDGRQVLAVDVPSARFRGLVRLLTLVHGWFTLGHMKLVVLSIVGARYGVNVDVACVGDPYLDLIFLGLPALPTPGEEQLADRLVVVPGGMANVAYALGRLELAAVVCAPIGHDPAGRLLGELMADAGRHLARA